jgi:hypothetical protein
MWLCAVEVIKETATTVLKWKSKRQLVPIRIGHMKMLISLGDNALFQDCALFDLPSPTFKVPDR